MASYTLRLLATMRMEHRAAMEAVESQLEAVKVMMTGLNQFHDKLDKLSDYVLEARLELSKLRQDMGCNFRVVHGDILSAEGRIITRQIEAFDILHRLDNAEIRLSDLDDARA